MSLSKFPRTFGTNSPESEAVLGAIMDDLNYVDDCLNHMTHAELDRFMDVLELLYKNVNTTMARKGFEIEMTNLQIRSQLNSILHTTSV